MTDDRPHPAGPADETPEQRHARRRAQHERDLAILAAGGETGWWDENGRPAPWPADFFDPNTKWRPDTSDKPHSTNP
jgi:hypothetical protein